MFCFKDPFRKLYPNLKKYTWTKKNPLKQARLGFYLLSENLMDFVDKVMIKSKYPSNHSGVVLQLKLCSSPIGRGLWKFNNSLLRDKHYVEMIKEKLMDIKEQYAVPVYNLGNINNISNQNIQFILNDQLFQETILMKIGGENNILFIFNKESRKYFAY